MSALDVEFTRIFNQLPGELYQNSVEGVDGNVVISPFSILIALSFAMFGASGRTSNEIKNTLNFNEISEEKLLESFQKLTKNMEKGGLMMANKFYLKKSSTVKQKFHEIATKVFKSDTKSVDFRNNLVTAKGINEWVETKTNNKIKNLVDADSLNKDTELVLVNAIYFKADWEVPFDSMKNFKNRFYLNHEDFVETEYMTQRKHFQHGKFDEFDATVLQMPYKYTKTSMVFVLPNSKTGLSALESKLSDVNFSEFVDRLSKRDVKVVIPKFKIEFGIDLEEPLKKLGIERLFTDNAEFGNLLMSSEPLEVSHFVHKAIIEVDESGTEASSPTTATESFYRRLWSQQSLPTTFVADHPFLFVLIEDTKVLFVGRKVQ